MNKLITHSLLFTFCAINVNAQNLVPNSGFDDLNACPSTYAGIDYSSTYSSFSTVKSWIRPTGGTPDYFNTCSSSSDVGVPSNHFGSQSPRSGNAYAGMIVYYSGTTYAEYIETKLTDSMKAGHKYFVSFFLNLSEKSYYSTDKIAAHFSDTQYYNSPFSSSRLSLSEDICSPVLSYFRDTTNWVQVSGTYIAKGGERWMTIGKFTDTGTFRTMSVRYYSSVGSLPYCYLYVDDVSIYDLYNVDTTICVSTFPKTISCSHTGGKRRWNTGDTTGSLSVTSASKYWCVDSLLGLVITDTFRIKVSKSIGLDTQFCLNSFPYRLHGSSVSGKYTWNTGDTSSTLSITGPGTYWRKTIDNPCVNYTDTFKIKLLQNKGFDTVICLSSFPDTIYSSGVSGKYVWNTGDTTSSLSINSIGTYWRRTIDSPCVNYTDTFKIRALKSTGIDTMICVSNYPYTLHGSITTGKYLWNTSDTTANLIVTGPGTYWRKTIDSPCVDYTDTFKISNIKTTGMDTIVCISSFPDTIHGSSMPGAYAWNTGDSIAAIRITAAGTYWRHTVNSPCVDYTDTIKVRLIKTSGIDTSICASSFPFTLYPATASGRYLWNTGDTSASLSITTGGVYWRITIDSPCINYTDTFKVGKTKTKGFDTSICATAPPVLLFDSGFSYGSFMWCIGVKTAAISVSASGVYWRKTTMGTCVNFTDTFKLQFFKGKGIDTLICNPVFPIKLGAKLSSCKYLWATGDSTYTISIKDTGLFWRKTTGYCISYVDTVKVKETPKPFIGNDSTYCFRDQITLTSNNVYDSYLWNNGAKTRSIQAEQPGTYILAATDRCGTKTDTVNVGIYTPPSPLVVNSTICQDDSNVMLTAVGQNLLWYTDTNRLGSHTQPVIDANSIGNQTLYVTQTINNCESDPVPLNMTIIPRPTFKLGNDTTVCDKSGLIIGKPDTAVTYAWSTGDTSCCIIPQKSGLYILRQTNVCGTTSDSINIQAYSCDCIWVPTAFSPNGDGKNDFLHVIQRCPVRVFTIHVYNRFGQVVFRSGNINNSWDGTYLGVPVEVGDYYYYINYAPDIPGQEEKIYKGEVTLIR